MHGGFLADGSLPFSPKEWDDDESSHVAVQLPDTDLDRVEDFAREALISENFRDFVSNLKLTLQRRAQAEALMMLFTALEKFQNRLMALDALKYLCGAAALSGQDQTSYAKKYGVSKEAVHQYVKKWREILRMRQTRTMRTEQARENMRLRNYRRT